MLIKKSNQGVNYYLDEKIENIRYPEARLLNRQKAEQAYKDNVTLPFPLHLIIESTNRCNLKCPMCNRETMTRPVMDLDFNLYQRVIDECSKNKIYSVSLYALGEPMLHPRIMQMIDYAKLKGISYVDTSTNATKDLKPLINSGLDEIIISLDGFKDQFEQMRYPAKHEDIIANIEDFLAVKKLATHALAAHALGEKPIVRLQIIKNKLTEPIIDKFIEHWINKVDVIYVKNLEYMIQNLGYKNISEEKAEQVERTPCKQLWFLLTLNSNGDIAYCCHDSKGKSVLGNIKDMTIKQAWEKLDPIRQKHKSEFYTSLCAECKDFKW